MEQNYNPNPLAQTNLRLTVATDPAICYQSQYQSEKNTNISQITIKQYFRFAKKVDYLYMFIGSTFCIAYGSLVPFFSLLWGEMVDAFQNKQKIVSVTLDLLKFYMIIGACQFIISWIMNSFWMMTTKRQSLQCRRRYFSAILDQQIGWFDCSDERIIKSQLFKQTFIFQEGMNQSFTIIIYVLAGAVSNIIFCFIKGWILTFVILGLLPLMVLSIYMLVQSSSDKQKVQQEAYQKAEAISQQALSAIKTIKSFNASEFESKRYDNCLKEIGKKTKRYSIIFGLSFGGANSIILFIFALGFWFGANCIYRTNYCNVSNFQLTVGSIIAILFSIIIIGLNLSKLPNYLRKLSQGRIAAAKIFKIIDRQPKIKSPKDGVRIQNFKGIIQFHNVSFAYPKEPSKKILNGFNLTINKKKSGFVGDSGSGKSTIFRLIMRFYDPNEGFITVDGYDLREIDLEWWRNMIGYVGQEPVLFSGSIKENLLLSKQNASEQQLIEALKKAEAWDFINNFSNKMDTNIGEGESQISGGQKQRIAIARALIRRPKILFLDEATSALDLKNEKKIQETLDKLSQEISSITITHRVSTIVGCEQIFCLSEGKVAQKGKITELKRFRNIMSMQNIDNRKESEDISNHDETQVGNNGQQNNEEQKVELKMQKQKQITKNFSFRRVLSYANNKKTLFVIGMFVTAVFGSIFSIFSVLLSNVITILLNKQERIDSVNKNMLIISLLGVFSLLLGLVQTMIFQYIGSNISLKIRSQTFSKLMKLPIPWFEKEQNSIGEISLKLGIGCFHMKELATVYIYAIFQNIFTLASAVAISLFYQWRTGLVFIGLLPFSIGATGLRVYFDYKFNHQSIKNGKKTTFNSHQVISNIRTVRSLGYDQKFKQIYNKSLEKQEKSIFKLSVISGFFFGLTEIFFYFVAAFIFYIGAIFVVQYNNQLLNMITAIFALNFGAQSIGNNSYIIPDATKCKLSIGHLFQILNTKDEQDDQIQYKSMMIKDKPITQCIVFKDITFKYPSRKYLFKKLNLELGVKGKVGFVGESGCGKSTIFSLLLRFYQPLSGTILLDGVNIKDYDIHYLRSQFGAVFQEPALFNTSIIQNLIYNLSDTDQKRLVQTLKISDALNFVGQRGILQKDTSLQKINMQQQQLPSYSSLSKSLERTVGPKGSHISGGQKQRLAIARAILRQNPILLMDEATSNLDNFSEWRVQKNLDSLPSKKLLVVIAHRVETIINSDVLMVFKGGEVIEKGSYRQLIEKKGYFFELCKGQIMNWKQ